MADIKGRYNGIQILRAILFVGIVAFHSSIPGSQILWGGVEIFFVISSYFLTKKLSKSQSGDIQLVSNIKHRFLRLAPVYYLVLIGAFGLIAIVNRVIALGDLVVHGIFSQNFYWMITGYRSDLNVFTAHTWTLSIEFWLFFVWLVAFRFAKSDKARAFFNIISIVCAISWRMVTVVWVQDVMITSLCPIAHMDAFALGSLMALYEKTGLSRIRGCLLEPVYWECS